MKIVIIKYPAGNVQSIMFSLEKLGIKSVLTDNIEIIKNSDKVIIPGVGEAQTAMQYFNKKNLDKIIVNLKQPVLGICLGMQILCQFTEENNTNCLGIFNLKVKKIPIINSCKVPHIGWNNIYNLKDKIYNGVQTNAYQYFAQSYYVELNNDTIASVQYYIEYSAAIRKNNFYAIQFHPEKSGVYGQTILNNFVKL
jgi:imidazole glycerol-phosphate synthase subunit HisH